MAFWGIEIKAGKPFTLLPDKTCGRLRISQATLGIGSSNNKSFVQCNVGKKTPVLLCCLLPDKAESCHLDLEFEEADEVTFSVVGPRSVHLTGYFLGNARRLVMGNDDSESYGEDIRDTETERSDDPGKDEYEDSFIDDSDPEVFAPSPSPSDEINKKKSGGRKCSRKRLKKKYALSESEEDGATSQQNTTHDHDCEQMVESEQEDQIPISSLQGSSKGVHEDSTRKKHDVSGLTTDDRQSEDNRVKKKKKRKNNKENETLMEMEKPSSLGKNETDSQKDTSNKTKFSPRTITGGLVVEELQVGEEDGKVASSGRKVSIHYTGRLKYGGKIFDSTAGKDPLKFRLGKGRALDGLDLGIEGMRVGGKRRLIIPPALGYGSEGSDRVPPNSWLMMDVELVRVR